MRIIGHAARRAGTGLAWLPCLVASSLLASACTTVTMQSFRVVDSPNVESVLLAMDADFGKYDQLTAAEMGIYFPTEAAPSSDDQARLRQIFRQAFLGELSGYRIVSEPGPTTLMVQASLIDFRNATSIDATSMRSELRDIAKPGALVFLMELKDSETGKILAQAADNSPVLAFAGATHAATDWTTVESTVARWASLFRRFLDENLND